MELQAFLNSNTIKTKYVQRLKTHYNQDEIRKGTYWKNGKGCAIGCTIHSDSHICYESEIGIPEWVARLEDILFEGMSDEDGKSFPVRLFESIPVGFDNWKHIFHQICLHILEKECKNTDHPLVKQAISDIIILHKSEETDETKWFVAKSVAKSAAKSAKSVAKSAAKSAAGSAKSVAKSAAKSAAGSAAESAWSAAMSAESAAESAWSVGSAAESAEYAAMYAAMSAESAESAWSAAWSAAKSAGSAAWSAAMSTESAAMSTESAAWSAEYARYARYAARYIGSVTYKSITNKLIELFGAG